MFTTELVEKLPTTALSDFGKALEGLSTLVDRVDDCELVVIEVEEGLHRAIHMIDAELQRRPD
jgi:hypothetical protein